MCYICILIMQLSIKVSFLQSCISVRKHLANGKRQKPQGIWAIQNVWNPFGDIYMASMLIMRVSLQHSLHCGVWTSDWLWEGAKRVHPRVWLHLPHPSPPGLSVRQLQGVHIYLREGKNWGVHPSWETNIKAPPQSLVIYVSPVSSLF